MSFVLLIGKTIFGLSEILPFTFLIGKNDILSQQDFVGDALDCMVTFRISTNYNRYDFRG